MSEPAGTINTDAAAPSTDAPPAIRVPSFEGEDNPISVVEEKKPEPTPEPKKEVDSERFDKDPVFRERLNQMKARERKADEVINNMQRMMSELQNKPAGYENEIAALRSEIANLKGAKPSDMKRIQDIKKEEFLNMLENDHVGLMSMLANQIRSETLSEVKSVDEDKLMNKIFQHIDSRLTAREQNRTMEQTAKKFLSEHKDFVDMGDKIKEMKSENPGFDDMHAYLMLKLADATSEEKIESLVQEKLKAKLDDGAKKKTPRINESGRSSTPSRAMPKELMNTQNSGVNTDSLIARTIEKWRK